MPATPTPSTILTMEGVEIDRDKSRAMEHRWGVRLVCRAAVKLLCGDGAAGSGRLRNVSTSGAFIESSLAAPVFSAIEVKVKRADGTCGPAIHGCVVRRTASGMGVEWTETPSGCICPQLECTENCATADKAEHPTGAMHA